MRTLLVSTLLLAAVAAPSLAQKKVKSVENGVQIAEGDGAWARRAELLDGELASPERIEQAIAHYREPAASSTEAAWKLLRALHYAIDFTSLGESEKEARLSEAIALAQASIDRMQAADGESRARLLFWSAIAWGMRAQRVGLLTIVRQGVAGRMHDHAARSLALDPSVDQGGALRLLSRLHATLPRVPFVSGWVDREQALPLAERAYARDAAHPGNRLVLALALLERQPERGEQARALLESVVSAEPRSAFRVEDMAIRKQARERLDAIARGE